MHLRLFGLLRVGGFAVLSVLGSTQSFAQNAYITNQGDSTVSVIGTATGTVTATITDPTLSTPVGVAVSPNQSSVYVANNESATVSVISTGKDLAGAGRSAELLNGLDRLGEVDRHEPPRHLRVGLFLG